MSQQVENNFASQSSSTSW